MSTSSLKTSTSFDSTLRTAMISRNSITAKFESKLRKILQIVLNRHTFKFALGIPMAHVPSTLLLTTLSRSERIIYSRLSIFFVKKAEVVNFKIITIFLRRHEVFKRNSQTSAVIPRTLHGFQENSAPIKICCR